MNRPSQIRRSRSIPAAAATEKLSARTSRRAPKKVPSSEQGYTLLIAIFFIALLTLSLSLAVPVVTKSIQRNRDLETYHRGLQYRRAVQLYYRKFRAYPPNVDALVKTNEIRFLRKKYVDPSTGKDEWKPVMFGQNKVPIAMGFFGQPLSGGATSIAGIGPSGGNGLNGTPPNGGSGSAFGSPFSSGGSSSGASGGSIFGSSDSGSSGTSGSTDGSSGTSGTGTGSGSGSGSGGTSSSGSSSSPSGQTFGGAGIIGFSPGGSKQSILVYKKKNHYNEWEFTYDPISDMQTITGGNAGNNGLGNQPGIGQQPGLGQQPGFGQPPVGGGLGGPPMGGPGSNGGIGSPSPTNP
jgi:type II secretory pathway pseudopilin PulG